ncbi:unnamed protein product [Schistosoma mattheei]|uniref:Uncharacterized protein n=1 Tax=Schistosoma mattheei TaxID=31246 RepID=A0A183PV32_9TREM|nr:unnamed protein product [Schistosoma mattheei]
MAIRQMKSRKAARPNNISAEALKSDTEVTANMMYVSFRKIWDKEQEPLKEGYLIKISKKDLSKCENYRGITLLSVPGKVSDNVAVPDEIFGRRPISRSTGWTP